MKIVKRNIETLVAAGMLLVAMLVFAWGDGAFRFLGPVRRVVSPNGLNNAVFCFDNPMDSDVSGAIYTMLGSHVTEFGPKQNVVAGPNQACPTTGFKSQFLSWDGKADGVAVHSGVYIYQIRVEGQNFTGALLVVR